MTSTNEIKINTKTKSGRMIQDAIQAGMKVTQKDSGTILIVARSHKKTGQILQGLYFYPDGTGINAAVRADLALGLRRVADMREVLGL